MCWTVPDLAALSEYSARNCSGRAATGGRLGMPQLRPRNHAFRAAPPARAFLSLYDGQTDVDKV